MLSSKNYPVPTEIAIVLQVGLATQYPDWFTGVGANRVN